MCKPVHRAPAGGTRDTWLIGQPEMILMFFLFFSSAASQQHRGVFLAAARPSHLAGLLAFADSCVSGSARPEIG